MVVERTEQGILIKTTAPINLKAVQKIIDYYTVLEINSRAKGTEEEAAALANEIDKKWWAENKHRFSACYTPSGRIFDLFVNY